MSDQLQKRPIKQKGQAPFAGAHNSAADAAVDVREALSLLDSPPIRANQHRLGVLGSQDVGLVKSYLRSAQGKLPNDPSSAATGPANAAAGLGAGDVLKVVSDYLAIPLVTRRRASEPQSRRSVPRRVRCEFTAAEACHILSLIGGNECNGEHTAPQNQYWKRSERIKAKLAITPNAAPSHSGDK